MRRDRRNSEQNSLHQSLAILWEDWTWSGLSDGNITLVTSVIPLSDIRDLATAQTQKLFLRGPSKQLGATARTYNVRHDILGAPRA